MSAAAIAQEAPESLKVYFDTGSASIGADQGKTLDQAARLFRDGNPIVMIVSGGADTVGPPDFNLALSVERAQAVVRGLSERGIPVGRLQVLGRGISELEVTPPRMSLSLKTALRRSPGGDSASCRRRRSRRRGAGAAGGAQQAAESGAEAFARSDFAAAAELWRKEAAAGSAQAKFGLGLISDLGLGVPRDAAKALRWYLEAAEDGLSNAQFNVAVMLDAGTGVPRDVRAAAVWYGRAAANGHHRAQYNLGLLYEAGDGVPQNRRSRAILAGPRRGGASGGRGAPVEIGAGQELNSAPSRPRAFLPAPS